MIDRVQRGGLGCGGRRGRWPGRGGLRRRAWPWPWRWPSRLQSASAVAVGVGSALRLVGARAVLVDAVAGDVGRARVNRRVGVVAVDVGRRAVAVGVRVGRGLAADHGVLRSAATVSLPSPQSIVSADAVARGDRVVAALAEDRVGAALAVELVAPAPPRRTLAAALPVQRVAEVAARDVLDVGADVGAAGLTPSLAASSSEHVHVPPSPGTCRCRLRRDTSAPSPALS